METLDNTEWDVVIVGTGLQQSLLALALSRSGKKILHVDENDYYGGAEAALTLREAEEWAARASSGTAGAFSHASVVMPEATEFGAAPLPASARGYNLELSPQLLYARSSLIDRIVSSRIHSQLEFLPVGSWWVYANGARSDDAGHTEPSGSIQHGRLLKVPSGREDVFQDQVLDFKAKRALMKFLRFIAEFEDQAEVWEEHRDKPFPKFLSEQFKVPVDLHGPLLALTASPVSSGQTTTAYALPRIAMHLRSIGVFGPGFGAIIPKWGGMSEIVQLACRACAVGGGVYILGKGVSGTESAEAGNTARPGVSLRLKDGEVITTRWVVEEGSAPSDDDSKCCKSISIVNAPLKLLFPPLAEDSLPPASAVVVFPSGSLPLESPSATDDDQLPPVHIFVHSSETGECPTGQCVLYASTSLEGEDRFQLLRKAVDALLSTVGIAPRPQILWSMQFQQRSTVPAAITSALGPSASSEEHVLRFPPSSLDLVFDGSSLDRVRDVWKKIVGDEAGEFLVFEERRAEADADAGEDED